MTNFEKVPCVLLTKKGKRDALCQLWTHEVDSSKFFYGILDVCDPGVLGATFKRDDVWGVLFADGTGGGIAVFRIEEKFGSNTPLQVLLFFSGTESLQVVNESL